MTRFHRWARPTVAWMLAAAATLTVLSGCGGGGGAPPAATQAASAAATRYPLTVTSCGRTLTFDGPPERVLVDGAAYAVPLFALGVGDTVVKLANHRSGRIRANFDVPQSVSATLAALPTLDNGTNGVADEVVLAERPDLVIQAYDGADFGAAGGRRAIDRLAAKGVNVFTLAPDCGGDLEASLADITRLGAIFDRGAEAAAVVQEARDRIAAARERALAATGGRAPRVFFLDGIGDDGIVYGNTGAFALELIRTAGGRPVPSTGNPADIYTVSPEAVVAANPDIVATYSQDDPPAGRLEKLRELQPTAPASRDRRTVVLTYPDGGGTVEFVELLADAIADWGRAGK